MKTKALLSRVSALGFAGAAILAAAPAASAAKTVGWFELKGAPLQRPDPFAWLKEDDAQPTLRDIVVIFETAAKRDDIDAVVIRLREPKLAMSQIEEIGAAIAQVRAAGKTVHLFTEIYGPSELMLGSYVDEVIMQSGGAATLPGLYMEEMFLADTLSMIGVKADMVQVGDYKGAAEMMSNSAPSKEWDQNISQLLDSMYSQMRSKFTNGRGFTEAELDKVMEDGWLMTDAEAVRLGLIDAAIDRLDLDAHLEKRLGDFDYEMDIAPRSGAAGLDTSNPFALFGALMKEPDRKLRRDTIALVHIDGAIVDGESSEGGLMGGANVGSLTIREALKEIEDEDKVKGVIIRIDSPGGSAIASESIWLGVKSLAQHKPVWVSIGSMAASGGYYIAVSGDRIYVNPSSIVGSIGVVGGKYVMGGLYDKLNVNIVARARGPRADLNSTVQPWSEAQRAMVRDRMSQIYDLFVSRVEQGRDDIDIAKTAEGRLFTGDKAIGLKMADKIGGLTTAIVDMAAETGLSEGHYDVVSYPGPKGFAEMIESMFGRFVTAPGVNADRPSVLLTEAVAALREIVGPASWPAVRDALSAMLELRDEQVLLVNPRALIFR